LHGSFLLRLVGRLHVTAEFATVMSWLRWLKKGLKLNDVFRI